MLNQQQTPKGQTRFSFAACFGIALLVVASASAESVYRCGDEYSPSAQCPNGHPAEVKASAVLRSNPTDKAANAANDRQEAEGLEKKRLQAERQAAQTAPVRFSASSHTISQNLNTNAERSPALNKGKRARKPQSPYFTAKDPTAPPKKKSNAKALPSTN